MLAGMVVVEEVRKQSSQGVCLIVPPHGLCYGSRRATVVMTLFVS
jgi:alpha/beta superfamily hydrolase